MMRNHGSSLPHGTFKHNNTLYSIALFNKGKSDGRTA